jgi:HEAT repeat protein
MPRGPGRRLPRGSRAELRLRIEELLRRKEAAPEGAWADLGEGATDLLVELVNDDAMRSNPALRNRAIATVGVLQLEQGVGHLARVANDREEANTARAFAVNALGRIGTAAAAEAIAPLISTDDDMIRRQVAMALGRVQDPVALPYLIALRSDKSPAVSEVADQALGERESRVRSAVGPVERAQAPRARRGGKRRPMAER